ncbi:60S ribosomal protein L6, mitochondrial-like [Heracleum sosnowskyi]|uniref:60S ribosomal protein L6, mitochondrial-like n=1 Tax=Heracleum sosnowskyi TaxID=360622 RepID=A0AAD8JEX6_9APIA|nr:60S ribosomal protein L6, mitochondrial-like [Heracleum sosnowskyi]KAK1401185.1 60S ribosomal protein L6, mitochondrial-like [Heracleum sosnowskyi]
MEGKFFRILRIAGLGYKARSESEGRLLYLKIGYNHEVQVTVPPAVRVFCFKPNATQKERKVATASPKRTVEIPKVEQIMCFVGIDKQRVNKFAADVRSLKPPQIYTGKGIFYMDEVLNLRPMYKKMTGSR